MSAEKGDGVGCHERDESELVPLSALQHWSYCPRQCALIHLERTFDENLFTLQGRLLHERADEPTGETLPGVRVERAVPLVSHRFGLVGKADVVEFRNGVPYPVEYKRGARRRSFGHDELQLCGQAICLEEMTGVAVPEGALFYHGSRRRRRVSFDSALRLQVEEAAIAVRRLLGGTVLPPPVADARCRSCSLLEACQPAVIANPSRVRSQVAGLFTSPSE